MTHLPKSLFFFLIFHLLVFASLYGVTVPNNSPATAVGSIQLASYKDGLALHQGLKDQSYNFSPFNDYTLGEDGVRISFITAEELNLGKYTSTYNKPHWIAVNELIKTYIGALHPEISFQAGRDSSYISQTEGNKLTVTRKLKATGTEPSVLGMTLTYNTNDFIYDTSGSLYNYFPDSDISSFERNYGIRLINQIDELMVPIPSKVIYIYSRSTSSVITVKAKDNQELFVNRNARLIEVQERTMPQYGAYEASMQIYIFSDPKEASTILWQSYL